MISSNNDVRMQRIGKTLLAVSIAGIFHSTGQHAKGQDFTFHAFGDAGWAETHKGNPQYNKGYLKAYKRFDPNKQLIGDLNYINWETGVGNKCSEFWSQQSPSTYAFMSPTNDLRDAINHGFNVIGLANNHSYDCLRSPEGEGPLQTYNNVKAIQSKLGPKRFVFSGIYKSFNEEGQQKWLKASNKGIPIIFASAYVGGNASHCQHILCTYDLEQLKNKFKDKKALRVLALHSWNKSTHAKLKQILRSWTRQGLVDLAIGSGPHIAESIEIVPTKDGNKILATSLGNFIHPSLAPQPNNSVLTTRWKYTENQRFQLLEAKNIKVSCDGGECRQVNTTTLLK